MHRIDSPGATGANQFTEGDPALGVPATEVGETWLNDAVQEELCQFVENQGIVLDKLNNGQLEEAIDLKVNAASADALSNSLMNNSFDIWQRGTSIALSGGVAKYTADRWYVDCGTGGAGTASRVAQSPGTILGVETINAFQLIQGTSATSQTTLDQQIEDVQSYAGKKITISFYLKKPFGGVINITPKIVQNFGPAGSPDVSITGAAWPVDNAAGWARYSQTVDVPDITGKTITQVGSFLSIMLNIGASGASLDIAIANAQIDLGDTALEFRPRPKQVELAMCQRYCEKSYSHDDAPGTVVSLGSLSSHEPGSIEIHNIGRGYKVEKRDVPTLTWFSPATGAAANISLLTGGVTGDRSVVSQHDGNESQTGWITLSGAATDPVVRAHFLATAELK